MYIYVTIHSELLLYFWFAANTPYYVNQKMNLHNVTTLRHGWRFLELSRRRKSTYHLTLSVEKKKFLNGIPVAKIKGN